MSNKAQKYQGEVIYLSSTEIVPSTGQPKRTIVVSDKTDTYPQELPFEFYGEKNVPKLDGIQVGTEVEVTYEPKGRKMRDENKWWASYGGWGISMISGGSRSQQAQGQPAPFHPDNDEEGEIF